MWPAVWMAFFFGTWGTAFIVGWIGMVQGAVLLSLPPEQSSLDRWIDVVVAVFHRRRRRALARGPQRAAGRGRAGSRTRRASTRSPGC